MAKNDIIFKVVTPETIARLKRDGKVEVPEKKLSVSKDERWNEKFLNTQVIRGLETGESVKKIADRMFPEMLGRTPLQGKSEKEVAGLVKRNIDSSIRNARTMVTSAENHGRLDSYKNLSSQGVAMKKEWEATPDDRTRPTHIDIDGEEQDIDKPFSNGCMFPGDGRGPAEEVWMCRCAMGAHIIGFKRVDGSISRVDYQPDETLHEKQMAEQRKIRFSNNAQKTDTYKSFAAEPDMQTMIIGKIDYGDIHKPGYEVQYATEYKGNGAEVSKFFSANTNNQNLINSMNADEKKAFKDMWSRGKFMHGQQYKGFASMKPKEQQATKIFDKYLDNATLNKGIEVVRLSDAQLVLGAGNVDGTLDAFLGMEGKQITCGANMSFSAASEGLRITPIGKAPTVEYVLRIPEGSKGAGMYIGDDSINIWGDKQREFMTNRNIWMTVGKTEYNVNNGVFRVELDYGGLMEHEY